MPQSLAQVYIHIIFSTKERREFLKDEALRKEMHAYMASIFNDRECPAVLIGGTADHVHVLCRLSRSETIAKLIGEIKRLTSLWIKRRDPGMRDFNWQNGYGVFSVSASNAEAVKKYILRQEEHHKKMTFQDELRALLKKHGVSYDERYLWD
jgi:putative transposase